MTDANYRKALLRVLPLLHPDVDRFEPVNANRSISVANIVNVPWSEKRLASVREAIDQGQKLDPITVTGFRIAGKTYYIPSDGMHRVEAARLRGDARMRAFVSCKVDCEPDRYLLNVERRELWIVDARLGPGIYRFVADQLTDDEMKLLDRFGVPRKRI